MHPTRGSLNLQDARRLVTRFVEHYTTVRLHSAIGYINPADKLAGKEEAIFVARDQKLLQARETRKTKRNQNNIHSLAVTPDETKNHVVPRACAAAAQTTPCCAMF